MRDTATDRTVTAPRSAVEPPAPYSLARGRLPVGVATLQLAAAWRARSTQLRTWSADEGAAKAFEVAAAELEAALGSRAAPAPSDGAPRTPANESWRDRLWTVAPETRLGVSECAEAIGRPTSYVYKHTSERGKGVRLPHRKLDGHVVFLAGELRDWLDLAERVISTSVRPLRAPARRVGSPLHGA